MKITTWQTVIPAELKRQLTEFERRFEALKTSVAKILLDPVFRYVKWTNPQTSRTLTIPDRDVDLSERHDLDPWVVVTTDLLASNNTAPEWHDGFLVSAVAGGTQTKITEDNHPGAIQVTTPATISSGIIVSAGPFLSAGGEYVVTTFKTPSAFTDRRILIGLFQSNTAFGEPVDGCYFWMNGTSTLVGKTSDTSTRSTTGTSLTLNVDTWYTAVVRVNGAKTLVTYSVYSDAGARIWSDTLNTNIPTATPNQYGGCKLSVIAASALIVGTVDYVQVRVGGPRRQLRRYTGSSEELFT